MNYQDLLIESRLRIEAAERRATLRASLGDLPDRPASPPRRLGWAFRPLPRKLRADRSQPTARAA